MWIYYNPNPSGRTVGDCSVRAVAKALDVSWEAAYSMIAASGYSLNDMPSSNSVWGSVLKNHGFMRHAIPNQCPDCYTAEDFSKDHPEGVFVLGFGNHVCTLVDGDIYDSWDSSKEIPQYYWFKHEEREEK